MGGNHGNYSRNMYSEDKLYVRRLVQQGVPWVDADDNDLEYGRYNALRRIEQLLGDGAVGDGFKCVPIPAANDFRILGGDGTAEGAGRFFLQGNGCLLYDAVDFKNSGATVGEKSIKPRVTAVEYVIATDRTLYTDSAANWDVDEHAGKTITPDITQPGATYTIESNTRTVLTIIGDATVVTQVGDCYRIEMTTPSGTNRTDGVFLNVYLDEYDCTDDPNLVHNLSTQVCAQLRTKLVQEIYVKEGSETFGDYVDSDGNQHWTYEIARIHRSDGIDVITDIEDLRRILMGNDLWRLWELYNNLRVIWNDPNDENVSVLPGWWTISDRSLIRRLPVQTVVGPFAPVSASNKTRYDLVSIDDSGALTVRMGTEVTGAGNPWDDVPPPWANQLALGIVRVNETSGVVISEDDITDSREFLNIGGAPINLDAYNSATWLRPHQQATPDDTVRVEPGTWMSSDGSRPLNQATSFSSPLFPAVVGVGNDRYDLLCMNDSGNPVIVSGVEGTGGTPWSRCPNLPTNALTIAIVRVTETGTVVIDSNDITDAREFLNKGGGGTPPAPGNFDGLLPQLNFIPDDNYPCENVELWQTDSAIRFQAWENEYAWFSMECLDALNRTKDINFKMSSAITNDGSAGEKISFNLDYWIVTSGNQPNFAVPDGSKEEEIDVSARTGNTLYYDTFVNFKIDSADLPVSNGRIMCRIWRNITGVPVNSAAALDVLALIPYQA